MLHLRSITPRIPVDSSQGFPFDVPVIQSFRGMTFAHEVTFFVGENGSGKSTLLEAIACAAGMVSVGAEELSRDHTLAQLQRLANSFKLVWTKKTNKGFFLRSEDFFSFAKRIAAIKEALESDVQDVDRDYADRSDHARGLAKMAYLRELAALRAFYGDGLDAQSHGESFFKLFRSRFKPGGLYLLDEPEAPLSPMRQIIFLSMLRTMVRQDAQFIIATHSPILLAYPGAAIYSFEHGEIIQTEYARLEHVGVTRAFLQNPAQFLEPLFEDADRSMDAG